jgi:hypothetical protein
MAASTRRPDDESDAQGRRVIRDTRWDQFERQATACWADIAARPPLFAGTRSEIDEAISASDRDWAGEGPE